MRNIALILPGEEGRRGELRGEDRIGQEGWGVERRGVERTGGVGS